MPKTETNEQYQARMTAKALEVSKFFDGMKADEVAFIAAKLAGYALGNLEEPERAKAMLHVLSMIDYAMDASEADNARG